MKVVVAPVEYKGTLTAREAAEAIAAGVRRAAPDAEIDLAPVSDGGPGFVDVFLGSLLGKLVQSVVQNPLGRRIQAAWAMLEDRTAVIEVASAAGLSLLRPEERDPRVTTSYGVGQLISAALDSRAERIVVGLGGTATNDGGAGMAAALGARFLDRRKTTLLPGGAALAQLEFIDIFEFDQRAKAVPVVAATDVRNPLCGPKGASIVYGPQKGASGSTARALDSALKRYARIVEKTLGARMLDVPGGGAAGGIGAGLIAFLGAEVRSGFDIVAQITHLYQRIGGADLVITGEGRLDAQTAYGKAVSRVADFAREAHVPVIAVPGALGDGWEALKDKLDAIQPLDGVEGEPAARLAKGTARAVSAWTEAKEAV
jgi:glycerate kinase